MPSKNGDICWLVLIRNECRSFLVRGNNWVTKEEQAIWYNDRNGWPCLICIMGHRVCVCARAHMHVCVFFLLIHRVWMLQEEHIIVQKLFFYSYKAKRKKSFGGRGHLANWNADNPGVTPLPALTVDFRDKGNAKHNGRRRIGIHTKISNVHQMCFHLCHQ